MCPPTAEGCGGGGNIPVPKKNLGGWKIGDVINTSMVEGILTKIFSQKISGEATIYVEVETKDGTKVKVWVNVKAGT